MCEDLRQKLGMLHDRFKYVVDFEPAKLEAMNNNQLVNFEPLPEPSDFNKLIKSMSLRSVSNNMKHFTALSDIATKPANGIYMVLEDDVCFGDMVKSQIEKVIKGLSAIDSDVVFLGFPGIKNAPGSSFIRTNEIYKVIPGCDSYIITPDAAKKLVSAYLPLKFVNHAHLSWLMEKLDLKAYMSTPHVFVEGSKLGIYTSSLNPNNSLIYNPSYKEMFETIHKNEVFTAEQQAQLDKLWNDNPFKTHPDFLYLKGLYMLKSNQYKKAKDTFEAVFNLYQSNNCILGRDSVFLNNYIEVCKLFQ